MQYITGHRPDDVSFLDSQNISRAEVSASLARIFNTMIFADNCPLHCDPHGGNLAIRPNPNRRYPYNFDVILYDHGLYRDIPLTLRRNYARLWLAVIDADVPKMREYAYKVAGITDEQFPLFASAITGRDYHVLLKQASPGDSPSSVGGVMSARTSNEKENISEAFGDNLLQQLVQLLGKVPRIILLILKTNDLTRSLDEGLQTGEGPERTFLILARYASRAVYEEEKERLLDDDFDSAPSETREETTLQEDDMFLSEQQTGIERRPKASRMRLLTHRPIRRLTKFLMIWLNFRRVELKLWFYERYIHYCRHIGFS